MTSPKKKAAPVKEAANLNPPDTNTTSVASQRNAIVRIIRKHGAMSTLDARANGIMHPAMRVCELRKRGYNIVTHWITQTDDAGVTHRVAIYAMEGSEK